LLRRLIRLPLSSLLRISPDIAVVDIGGLDAAGSMAEMLTMARMLSPLPLRRSRLESCERNDGHDAETMMMI
jgi:hypothetical protein